MALLHPRGFDRQADEEVCDILIDAGNFAARLGQRSVCPDHLLIALIRAENCTVKRIINDMLSIRSRNDLFSKLYDLSRRHLVAMGTSIYLTREIEMILALAYLVEAHSRGAEKLDTVDLLLALTLYCEDHGLEVAEILAGFGLTRKRIGQHMLESMVNSRLQIIGIDPDIGNLGRVFPDYGPIESHLFSVFRPALDYEALVRVYTGKGPGVAVSPYDFVKLGSDYLDAIIRGDAFVSNDPSDFQTWVENTVAARFQFSGLPS